MNRGIALFTVSLGLVIPVFGGRPVLIMIVSQAFAAVVTPIIIILMIILLNKKSMMGEHAATVRFNMILGIIFIFTVFMAATGLYGIRGLL